MLDLLKYFLSYPDQVNVALNNGDLVYTSLFFPIFKTSNGLTIKLHDNNNDLVSDSGVLSQDLKKITFSSVSTLAGTYYISINGEYINFINL